MTQSQKANGFKLGKRWLTLYWDPDGEAYDVQLNSSAGVRGNGGRISTPVGFYHLLRHVGEKGWGTPHRQIRALIRAMGKRFNWSSFDVNRLVRHGMFSYDRTNGQGGSCHFEFAWMDQ